MSLRDELVPVVARDARYTVEAYEFIFAALEQARHLKRKRRPQMGRGPRRSRYYVPWKHVTGQEICEAARDLALNLYGLLAMTVLGQWGLRSTSDLGNVVFHLIESGDLEKTPSDSRADFDEVFDWETAFRSDFVIELDDVV